MSTQSRSTTFTGLFLPNETDEIQAIEIPLIQRDYAQGRESQAVDEIRKNFIDVLHSAVAGEKPAPVDLDFVYGEVKSGVLEPLDGQQRLTTLFLLHWYLASGAGELPSTQAWAKFTYATRPSARLFCERLVLTTLPDTVEQPSSWVIDQPWYLFVWRHDPTIQSMLVMLDAIHLRFRTADAKMAWDRLVDPIEPAVSFLLLAPSDMGSAADLYIKMNSRGKPLTEFENFKAHFEKSIEATERAKEFAENVDGAWSDLLWGFRGDDDLVDDEFMRYIGYITELCEWLDPDVEVPEHPERPSHRTERVFGGVNPRRAESLDFLFKAFDVWVGRNVDGEFNGLFRGTTERQVGFEADRVALFFRDQRINLFDACCRTFGDTSGRTRVFTFGQSLLLFAVLRHLMYGTDAIQARIRSLRNLIEASANELRVDRMPRLLRDVERLVRDGALGEIDSFNKQQVEDELLKQVFLDANPELTESLHRLEDNHLLRGSIGAFELEPTKFDARADAFLRLASEPESWLDATGALLAVGEYQRTTNHRKFQFGTGSKRFENAWRELLTGADREALSGTRSALAKLLDAIEVGDDLKSTLVAVQSEWLAQRESELFLDWRYYMVKYPAMREGASGTYYSQGGALGYSLCMLRGGTSTLNSKYRDPYVLAIWRNLGNPRDIDDPWFTGHETLPRWLRLTRSGVRIRPVSTGFEVSGPVPDDFEELYGSLRGELGMSEGGIIEIKQMDGIDTVDRIAIGTEIVRQLLERGL
ncbi:DUF262 domain-containing protein [Arthrobacter sp. Soil762]|uniref:DUF262 domain-containing protein n=1 Tax=Arthrobacter sp. Soil762 TaxID=1736401 RepID=UPI0006F31775|nr:DUF262 domain-containing protein [Arthrobacter sp. Soil762]KRE71702.1 hypothetical protein ASG77_11855 [Arthrobacter sp. Soil762]